MLDLGPFPGGLVTSGGNIEVGTRRLHETDVGDAVVAGDLQGPHPLLDAVGGHGPGLDSGVVAQNDALGVGDHPDAEHEPAAYGVVGVVAGQGADLKERAVGVQDVGDAFPDGHLPP